MLLIDIVNGGKFIRSTGFVQFKTFCADEITVYGCLMLFYVFVSSLHLRVQWDKAFISDASVKAEFFIFFWSFFAVFSYHDDLYNSKIHMYIYIILWYTSASLMQDKLCQHAS